MEYPGKKLCGVADYMGAADCAWPMKRVTVYAGGKIGRVDMADAFEHAIAAWNAVCGIRLEMTPHERTANIRATIGHEDGPGGSLAWSELPCFGGGQIRQLLQEYDVAEAFVISSNPAPHQIDLAAVATHELGHAIGLGHISPGNLLQPMYDPRIRHPQRGDIQEAVYRYGHPEVEPEPAPVPGEPAPAIPDAACYGLTTDEIRVLVKLGVKTMAWLRSNGTAEQIQAVERIVSR